MIVQMSLPPPKILLNRPLIVIPFHPPHTKQHLSNSHFNLLSVSSRDIALLVYVITSSASDSRLPRIVVVVLLHSSAAFLVATPSATFKIRLIVEESVGCGADLV